jgi:hypothetical protein
MGRPRIFDDPCHIHLTVERADYEILTEIQAAQYPDARHITDMVRELVLRAVRDWRRGEAERTGMVARRRERIRKLAAQTAEASDERIEHQARKLIALVEDEPAA